ncbi:bifunctional diguanylate cyclase/phosphodiesterase [Nereida sp. MMG025]|uniref:putative bifunctional diguanylate cyclase/phosphodiesterase n=1 Tax=Nereida sp. MMG025 TaxID=2909981 RepID=UPI001F3D216C|nr:bifunctional diguanylate cyclase/phosphodiesterase [Nereida sp. MMG025]MCF6444253.1 bifunctional diguanylate cyclase/phosphodiesterase [Nereida sp. MMG025]
MTAVALGCIAITTYNIARAPEPRDAEISPLGTVNRSFFMDQLERTFEVRADTGRTSICLAFQLDDYTGLVESHGSIAADQVIRDLIPRVRSVLRHTDIMTQIDTARFAVLLSPKHRMTLETGLQLAARLQKAIEEPFVIDGTTIYCSASIGFTLQDRLPDDTATAFLECSEIALKDARRQSPAGLRAYSDQIAATVLVEKSLGIEVQTAFENGQISPWFQPQISTDTGQISGFEALARWRHPEKGLIPPSEFLPAMQDAGLLETLSETMLAGALEALSTWDSQGTVVPSVGVNFSTQELRNPDLVTRIAWELDRFNLAPSRLSIEILETVIAGANDDVIVSNIRKLSELGCQIDLDDFGTGHASIAAIKRFSIDRIKIDRSFVAKVDTDKPQQRMLSAILSMAEELGLDTLAEGVETLGEHAMLCQLGCHHVQGFGLAKPMPFEETLDWIKKHTAKIENSKALRHRFG